MRKNLNKIEKTGIEPLVKYLTTTTKRNSQNKIVKYSKVTAAGKHNIYQCDSQSHEVLSLKKLFLNCHIQTRLPHNAAVQRAPRPTSLVCEFAETTMLIGESRWPDDEG